MKTAHCPTTKGSEPKIAIQFYLGDYRRGSHGRATKKMAEILSSPSRAGTLLIKPGFS
jgi:hypothetical protein